MPRDYWESSVQQFGHLEEDEETVERVVRVGGRTLTPEDTEAVLAQERRTEVYGTYGGGFTVPPEEIRRLVAEHKKQLVQEEVKQLTKEKENHGS